MIEIDEEIVLHKMLNCNIVVNSTIIDSSSSSQRGKLD